MIKKVVLTGGPGSGKTTVIESIKKNYLGKYHIIVVDETASHLMSMGIRPFGDNKIDMIDFQELVLREQLAKEEIVEKAITFLPDKNILIIYDRGIMDNSAYIDEEEFKKVINRVDNRYTVKDFLDRYDLILNLVSSKDFYTRDNNPERTEEIDEALSLGKKTLDSWLGHSNLKIIPPKEDINDKINDVLNHINEILKEEQVKRQVKYYVDLNKTDIDYLKSISKVAHLEQTYLKDQDNLEKRLRKITLSGITSYNYTVHKIKRNKRIKESEESIPKRTYYKLLEYKDPNKETIIKDRYYFPYEDKYYTLDIIEDYGILEINVSENEKVIVPPFIHAIENVTNREEFLNKNIANKNIKDLTKK